MYEAKVQGAPAKPINALSFGIFDFVRLMASNTGCKCLLIFFKSSFFKSFSIENSANFGP